MQCKRLLFFGLLFCWVLSCEGTSGPPQADGSLTNDGGTKEILSPEFTNKDFSPQDAPSAKEETTHTEQGSQERLVPDATPGDLSPGEGPSVDRDTAPIEKETKESSPPDSASAHLSAKYPNDTGIAKDPSVLFHDDFEQGWGKWRSPSADTKYLHIENNSGLAHGGQRFLRSTVTKAHLDAQEYISASTRFAFPRRVDQLYWRFYAHFKGIAPNPHHWVRVSAGDANFQSSGLANTVPAGDKGFWFDFDASNNDVFNFYAYWYKMRSGRCNDGSATPGCAGDQGTTYHYGNVFRPPNQTSYPHDKWFCIEIGAKTNTIGKSDGELSFWINDQLIDEYKPGHPVGTWLRDSFHTGGCSFSACTPPVPFEGFNFRSSSAVQFKEIFLDAYYERGTFANKKAALEKKGLTVSDEMTIYYDDVVVATQRIGCKVKR